MCRARPNSNNINSKEDLKDLVSQLRQRSDGRPIGIKIAAGKIEKDLEFCVFAEPDFITIDGRGGATGSSPFFLREATSVPTVYALHRARKYLDSVQSDIDLVITGGLRVSADFAKAIAMGADAVAIASAALISAACQQYRICGSGNCPVGVATQDPEPRKRLKKMLRRRGCQFPKYQCGRIGEPLLELLAMKIFTISVWMTCSTISREISEFTDIEHA